MVDVSSKEETERVAVAEGFLTAAPETLRRIAEGTLPKGDFRPTVQLAGIAVLTFCIPDEHVLAPRLKKLAARYGFEAYSPGWFMRWL